MGGACEGIGINSFIFSLHKSYSEHNRFMLQLRLEMANFIDEAQTTLVDLKERNRLKPLHLRYLADTK
jgi:hypothetical protein